MRPTLTWYILPSRQHTVIRHSVSKSPEMVAITGGEGSSTRHRKEDITGSGCKMYTYPASVPTTSRDIATEHRQGC